MSPIFMVKRPKNLWNNLQSPKHQLYLGAHNSTDRGEITPVYPFIFRPFAGAPCPSIYNDRLVACFVEYDPIMIFSQKKAIGR